MKTTRMSARLLSFVAVSTAALALISCASEQPRPQARPPVSAAPSPAGAPLSPAAYVATVGAIDLFIERASQLALTRSSSPRVRTIATMLAQEHRGLAAQLSFSGRRLNLLPPAALPLRLQHDLDELRTAPAFDAAYLNAMRSQHRELVSLQRSYASAGSSPTLRQTAAAALPIEQRHWQQLQR